MAFSQLMVAERTGALTPGERALLEEFVQDVVRTWPMEIEEVRLFGSRAEGFGHAESDLDVAVVFSGSGSREVARRLVDIAESVHSEREDLPWVRPLALFRASDPVQPAFASALRRGIVLWTRD